MKASVERLENNQVSLQIEIDEATFEQGLEKAYKKVVRQVAVPGFRKGKTPRKILEARYGKEVLFEDAVEILVPEAYMQAIEENNVDPVEQPKIDVVQLEAGKPLIFKAVVTVKPEVTLGEYKGVEVEAQPAEVSDEDVQRQLETMQKRHARVSTLTEGEAQLGDTAVIDFEGFKDGVPFEGGKGENHSLELGSNSFIPGFEDGLVGVPVGEERELNLTFPEQYHATELAGQAVVFKVTIKELKRKEYSPIDDEFAKDVSDFETLDELKEDIRKNLLSAAEKASEQAKQKAVVDKVVAASQVDVPEVMVDNRADQLMEEYGQRLSYQGVSLEQFLAMTKQTERDLKAQFIPEAEKVVKQELVLEAVAKAEGMSVTDEELDKEIEEIAANYRKPAPQIRKILESRGQLDALKQSILLDKAIKLIVDSAKEIAG
ncbi:trigger factor [Heliobacterium gestii]|uniref:Trigger factor n=1 Tax=Heliomicrobium gestii TaxID=2699 RepID=A0A845LFJ0_HELGE|nr:trigger factor [Heliomicrobium gestii]MBM7865345.1 trigger factor [Heliomicrobium gestii]MZP41606.1 trigger factor [Heliomicrobium gestii]